MTKFVLVSDLHGQSITLKYLQAIIKKEKPEAIIISGDITSGDNISFFNKLEEVVQTNNTDALVIWGNSDIPYANDHIEKSKYSVHLKKKKVGKFEIFGISETDNPIDVSGQINGTILVTHRPPSQALLKSKYKNAPTFHINGHLHSRRTAKQYPSTFHICVPTLQNGEYAVFYPKNKSVTFSRID